MTVGQSSLSIAEIPFIYTLVNLSAITASGQVSFENLYIAGLGAGLFGTFLVVVKPLQRNIDRHMRKIFVKLTNYRVEAKSSGSAKKDAIQVLDTSYMELSLGTTSIKYEKDKIAGTFYFLGILISFGIFLLYPPFQITISIEPNWSYAISGSIVIMIIIISKIQIGYLKQFSKKLQLNAMYMLFANQISGRALEPELLGIAGRAIDINNWVLVKEMIDKIIRSRERMS